jgi:hypothetical protein
MRFRFLHSTFFRTAILLRVASLLLGCSTLSSGNSHSTTPPAHTANDDDRDRTRPPRGEADAVRKGTGSAAEADSRRSTRKKMDAWDVTAASVQAVAPLVEQAARDNNLPPSIIYGVIWVESRFNPQATSPVGAMGLMQLMPKTARYLAECIKWEGDADAYDPAFNIAAGSYYVARLIRQFDGDVDLALAAYNAGPGNIEKWMNNTGLPDVSVEYYTMVQTAMQYFGPSPSSSAPIPVQDALPDDDALDKLGLAILIAGLSDRDFGLQRTDAANPFAALAHPAPPQ